MLNWIKLDWIELDWAATCLDYQGPFIKGLECRSVVAHGSELSTGAAFQLVLRDYAMSYACSLEPLMLTDANSMGEIK